MDLIKTFSDLFSNNPQQIVSILKNLFSPQQEHPQKTDYYSMPNYDWQPPNQQSVQEQPQIQENQLNWGVIMEIVKVLLSVLGKNKETKNEEIPPSKKLSKIEQLQKVE